jgi:hypothetical protein
MAAAIIPITNSSAEEEVERHSVDTHSMHSTDTDIEHDAAHPSGVLEADGEKARRDHEGPVTRTSTKGSWKDPGPPPDGGLTAWGQSE